MAKRIIPSVAAALIACNHLLAADKAASAPAAANDRQALLRVGTYNVHIGVPLGENTGSKHRLDFKRIGAVIRELDLDLVAINEIDSGCRRTNYAHQPALLSKEAGMGIVFAQAYALPSKRRTKHGADWGGYGVAAMAHKPLQVVEQFSLPLPEKYEPRTALIVRTVEKDPVYFVVTHLPAEQSSAGETLRVKCVREITRRVKTGGYSPVLIAGDFNAHPDSRTINELRKNWTIVGDGKLDPTFPADKPNERLDYIAFAPQDAFDVLDCKVVDERKASDHRPFAATLRRRKR